MYLTICTTIDYNQNESDIMKDFKLPNVQEEKTVLKTIRIKSTTLYKIEELSKKHNLSINRIVNECLEYALDNLTDNKSK